MSLIVIEDRGQLGSTLTRSGGDPAEYGRVVVPYSTDELVPRLIERTNSRPAHIHAHVSVRTE